MADDRPPWGWAAPGRVNFMGEHTDYNDGWVLPFAIQQHTKVALRVRDDDRLGIWSAQADEIVESTMTTTPGDVEGWAAYVSGTVWAIRADGHELPGLDVWVDSSVPIGAGLSSSAALECAVAVALSDRLGLGLTLDQLAALTRRAENDYVGAPTGVMDQVASLHSQARHVLLLDTRTMEREYVPFDPDAANIRLMVVDTRVSHDLADGGGYATRRRECEQAAADLGVTALRDCDLAMVDKLHDDVLRRRARHQVTDNARVHEAVGQLRAGDWEGLGRTFTASHHSLRDDFEISCSELDVAVATCVSAGALGARMTGGGFGGSVIALVRAQDADRVAATCRDAFAERGWADPHVLRVTPGAGAGRITE